jgi:hypothetical protein
MALSRRGFMRLSLGSAISLAGDRLWAQGVSTHTAKPLARPAPSGRPFNAHFIDVAAAAGLTAPVIYGEVPSKKYILETMGCGCAFIDYDNDGWMVIFILSGTRLEGVPAGTSNRLYRNNRDGTFTDVTEKAGLSAVGWASAVCVGDYNNDGFEDLFCTYFGQNRLYRNNGDGTFTDVTKEAGLSNAAGAQAAAFSITTVTAILISSSPTTCASRLSMRRFPARTATATGRGFLFCAGRAAFPWDSTLSTAIMATELLPT